MPKTLLLADDSVTIQKVVGISFASEDIELVTVDNGDDAIAQAKECRPDVILADVVMPGKNGYEVCEAIKADPTLNHVPVLLLTGTFEAFDEERAAAAGAAGHVAKPFEAQTLVGEVNRLLAESESSRMDTRPPTVTPLAETQLAAPTQAGRPAPLAARSAPPPATTELAADLASDSFDFFDDEIGDIASADHGAMSLDADDALGLDSPDTAFAFGEAESAPGIAEDLPAPRVASTRPPLREAAERTVAILPEDTESMGSPSEPAGWTESPPAAPHQDLQAPPPVAPLATPEPEPLVPLEPQGPSAATSFDFEGDSPLAGADAALPVDSSDLAQATLLDPAVGAGYDVSSSDLGDPLNGDLAGRETAPLAFSPAPPPAPQAPAVAPQVRSFDAPGFEEPDAFPAAPGDSLAAEPVLAAADLSEAALADAELADAELDESALEPLDPTPLAQPAPELGPQQTAAAILEQVSPQLRQQLHDTLEKMAWESFSNVTEQIVRQAIERVERVAWEIIPQLAQSIIREEIRKMKGESGDT